MNAKLLINVISQPLDFLTFKVQHYWLSVDPHILQLAAMCLRSCLSWKAADSTIMAGCHHTALALSVMQIQKLLLLCWHLILGHSRDVAPNISS